jgi:hypothetical protein
MNFLLEEEKEKEEELSYCTGPFWNGYSMRR